MFLDGSFFLEAFVDAAVIKDSVVVDEGVEEGALLVVSEEEKGTKNERLDRFLEAEEIRGCGATGRIIARIEIDRDYSRKKHVGETNSGEEVDLLDLGKVPDAVKQWDGKCQAHCEVRSEVPKTFSVFAAFTEDENGSQNVDKNVGQGIVLLLGGGFDLFF